MTYSIAGYCLSDAPEGCSYGTKIGRDARKGDNPEQAARRFAEQRLARFSKPEGTKWRIDVASALYGCGGEFRGSFIVEIIHVPAKTEVVSFEEDPDAK